MPDFIRVRFKDSGTEQTIPRPTALDENAYEVLDKPATDRNLRPIAPKFPAKNKTGQKAANPIEKENG